MVSKGEKELREAVCSNDLPLVQTILARYDVTKEYNLDRKEWIWEDDPPLHLAADRGRDDIVQALVEAGYNVNSYWVRGVYRMTSLHYAVAYGKMSTIECLLRLGADDTLWGSWGRTNYNYGGGTPLDWARMREKRGLAEAVRILEGHATAKPPPPPLSFEAMDPLAKLGERSRLSKELEEATRIQQEVAVKRVEKKDLEEKAVRDAKALEMLKEELQKQEDMMRGDETRLEALDLERELEELEENPCLLKKVDELQSQLGEIETIGKSVKELLLKEDCPVCFETPRQVFCCPLCDNWVCQECNRKIAGTTCPSCRGVLVGVGSMRRNKAVERLMGILGKDENEIGVPRRFNPRQIWKAR